MSLQAAELKHQVSRVDFAPSSHAITTEMFRHDSASNSQDCVLLLCNRRKIHTYVDNNDSYNVISKQSLKRLTQVGNYKMTKKDTRNSIRVSQQEQMNGIQFATQNGLLTYCQQRGIKSIMFNDIHVKYSAIIHSNSKHKSDLMQT